ncbi:MAG: dienelactone hydrolase family protein [Pseudomonadales bacterium]
MKKWLIRIVLALGILLVAAYIFFRMQGGTSGLVEMALPDFPDFPAAQTEFGEDAQGDIYFSTATPFDFDVILDGMNHALPTTGIGELILPEGASAENPVPVMVLLHGSGGISPGRERVYGELLAANGIGAFVVNYYSPRGVTEDTPYMVSVISITEFDALTDAYGALRMLNKHPAVDVSRIGVAGFSYGGMATRYALDSRVKQVLAPDLQPFAVHVDFYGPCFQNMNMPSTTGAPLLTLRGDEDNSNDLEACLQRESRLQQLGANVTAHIFPGAGHAWEANRERKLSESSPYVVGCLMEYDELGHAMANGEYIVNVPPQTSRADRVAIRMSSGDVMGSCVKYGYIIGRDDDTRDKANVIFLAYLKDVFGL